MRRIGLVVGVALSAAGCQHSHLASHYGVTVRGALARQVIAPNAGARAAPTQGLDPQEAAIVLDTYRRSLSPRGDADAARKTPVMVLPPAGAQQGQGGQ